MVPSAQANLLAGAVHPVMSSSNPSAMLEIKILVTSQMVRGNNHVGQAEKTHRGHIQVSVLRDDRR